MIRRTNKIAGLLVAATFISTVPATAADPISLGSQDGEISNAVAFVDGKYIYKGEKNDTDTEIYYYDGNSDKALDGYYNYEIDQKFDKNYVAVSDGSIEEAMDLSSGEAIGYSIDNFTEDAKKKLKRKLAKIKKYGDNASITSFTPIEKNKFADSWYYYQVKGADGNTYNGYVDDSGNYIDCTEIADLYVYSTSDKRIVKVDRFDQFDSTTNELKATAGNDIVVELSSNYKARVIGQDNRYIYRIIQVNNMQNVDRIKYSTSATSLTSTYYVQRISKLHGDEKDGAYEPLSVSSYQIDSTLNADSYNALITDYSSYTNANMFYKTVVVNGIIYIYSYDTQTNNGRLNADKVELQDDYKARKYKTIVGRDGNNTTMATDTTIDIPTASKTSGQDLDWIGDDRNSAISVDSNGDVWIVYDGQIKKSHNAGGFTTIYTCDDAMNALDVYDDKNLIAWEKDGEIYTTVVEGKSKGIEEANEILENTTSTTTSAAVTNKVGWDVLQNNQKVFYDATSTQVSNKWINVDGNSYFLKSDGTMATGWLNYNGKWYYLNSDGSMKIGWLSYDDNWYYLNLDGAMKTGWFNYGGKWYYLNESGAMMSNTIINGYKLDDSGALEK